MRAVSLLCANHPGRRVNIGRRCPRPESSTNDFGIPWLSTLYRAESDQGFWKSLDRLPFLLAAQLYLLPWGVTLMFYFSFLHLFFPRFAAGVAK
jgi:hypothetical protein